MGDGFSAEEDNNFKIYKYIVSFIYILNFW
jgi:hypothetical protein